WGGPPEGSAAKRRRRVRARVGGVPARIKEMLVVNFAPFRLDPANERLYRDDRAIPLRPKSFAVLHHLIERAGQRKRVDAARRDEPRAASSASREARRGSPDRRG